MTGNEYQKLASRTLRFDTSKYQWEQHALHGMVGEIGELHSIYQKAYQGHKEENVSEHKMKELGDLLWFIAEYCSSQDWLLDDVLEMNIEKLKKRYPDGFNSQQSIYRSEDDI